MISIIIAVAVFVGSFIYFWIDGKKLKKEDRQTGLTVLFSFLISLLAWCVVDLIALLGFITMGGVELTHVEVVNSTEIVALQDNSSVSGSFFLGSGSVDNTDYYVFYINTETGYKREKLNADSQSNPVYIKYITSDNEVPHIDSYGINTRKTLAANPRWFSVYASLIHKEHKVGDVISEEPSLGYINTYNPDDFRYEIFIPAGAIQENYVIDLK